jgi:hypothetical protein
MKVTTAKIYSAAAISSCLLLILWLNPRSLAVRADQSRAQYAAELRQLRDQLAASPTLGEADAVVILGQRALAEAAEQLVGLEIKLASGALLRLTSVAVEMKPAAALVRLGVQAISSTNGGATLNLRLTGRLTAPLMSSPASGASLRLPFQLTEMVLGSGEQLSPLLRNLFGDWLAPEKWNAALPPLEVPLELSEVMEIPARRFDVEGRMPMEVNTSAYQVRMNFSLASLMFLDGRAVVAFRLAPGAPAMGQTAMRYGNRDKSQTPTVNVSESEVAALEAEVARLSEQLIGKGDLRLRFHRRVINALLEQIAAARDTDLIIQLKPARLRSEEVSGLIRTLNYTDIEGGDGQADLRGLTVERMAGNRLDLRMNADGWLKARLRGREYGIPYRFSPNGTFAIKDEIVRLEVVGEGDQVWLRAAPRSQIPVEVGLELEIVGRSLGLSHTVMLQADRWFNRLALPTLISRELQVPRKIEAESGGKTRMTSSTTLRYSLSKLRVETQEDTMDITSDISVSLR